MKIVKTKEELKSNIDRSKTIALVMTMGALHDGHMHLVKAAKEKAEQVIVSIYVNPLQFGKNEDYSKYPRTLDKDIQKCEEHGVDVVFAPSDEQMYGDTRQISLKVGVLAEIFEGKTRPGHFDGVCQIVCKVFNLVRPDYAFFGQKDAQQLAVIKNMVQDLDMGIQICAVPIVREPSGLAMSSRNTFLSNDGKRTASQIYKVLNFARNNVICGMPPEEASEFYYNKLNSIEGIEVDYFEIVDPYTFSVPNPSKQMLIICAVKVEGVRLLDNLLIG
ncbi:pantoate--beta-alanine ligase [Actinomyces sp. zg-332]|uniref:pantoate--beta-alanine ligase n=1 Tax=Actinomyces sp. zg-332 TaxID=2708340 RepID=UPI00142135CB|nr:pantoate--beta-alanine ligase [Actinomyces sp. zg-332]QPK94327.1 pantoate--beta-alanine ligase [Actinomyces sp. zg-332]